MSPGSIPLTTSRSLLQSRATEFCFYKCHVGITCYWSGLRKGGSSVSSRAQNNICSVFCVVHMWARCFFFLPPPERTCGRDENWSVLYIRDSLSLLCLLALLYWVFELFLGFVHRVIGHHSSRLGARVHVVIIKVRESDPIVG